MCYSKVKHWTVNIWKIHEEKEIFRLQLQKYTGKFIITIRFCARNAFFLDIDWLPLIHILFISTLIDDWFNLLSQAKSINVLMSIKHKMVRNRAKNSWKVIAKIHANKLKIASTLWISVNIMSTTDAIYVPLKQNRTARDWMQTSFWMWFQSSNLKQLLHLKWNCSNNLFHVPNLIWWKDFDTDMHAGTDTILIDYSKGFSFIRACHMINHLWINRIYSHTLRKQVRILIYGSLTWFIQIYDESNEEERTR